MAQEQTAISQKEATRGLTDPALFAPTMAAKPYMWQMDFLTADGLASLAGYFGFGLPFRSDDIMHLWKLGLLRADLVISERKLRRRGLRARGTNEYGDFVYSDEREWRMSSNGRPVSQAGKHDTSIEPQFHPFRYFVLYHLHRTLRLNFGVRHASRMLRHEASVRAAQTWNDIASLAVITEPWQYQRLFGTLRIPSTLIDMQAAGTTMDTATDAALALLAEQTKEHGKLVEDLYRSIGLHALEDACQKICVAAEFLDPNKDIHILLRFGRGESRLKLKGSLGGSMLLLTMAEMVRRAAEHTFGIQLPEEDERGFGYRYKEAKFQLYGAERLLDGDRNVENEFIRHSGLDSGLRLRWYVEGKTEWHAIHSVIEAFGATEIDVIDLRGQFVEKDVLKFRQSLRDDKKKNVLSYVSLDADVPDNTRVLKVAVEAGDFFGRFFVSDPDFEFGNFTLSELEEVIWSLVLTAKAERVREQRGTDLEEMVDADQDGDAGTTDSERETLHAAIAGCRSGKHLMNAAQKALPDTLAHLVKNQQWGEALMRYAWEHRTMPNGRTRPIIEAIESGLRSTRANYTYTRREYMVNPEDGTLVRKKAQTAIATPVPNTNAGQQ